MCLPAVCIQYFQALTSAAVVAEAASREGIALAMKREMQERPTGQKQQVKSTKYLVIKIFAVEYLICKIV